MRAWRADVSRLWHARDGAAQLAAPALAGSAGAGNTGDADRRLGRWRCRNQRCERQTFTERLTAIAAPLARRTCHIAEFVRLLGHTAGGRPGERLMARLGMPVSDSTILRQPKRHAATRAPAAVRVLGIDDWSWRKGVSYGTVLVGLERRQVVDVLPDRSEAGKARWLERHPEVETISRDRCGLYAQGTLPGALQAAQVADRFHLLQNLRACIESHMTRVGRHHLGRKPTREAVPMQAHYGIYGTPVRQTSGSQQAPPPGSGTRPAPTFQFPAAKLAATGRD